MVLSVSDSSHTYLCFIYQCCSLEVAMLPEASAESNIPTKGEQHACYMVEHLTIDLLYH